MASLSPSQLLICTRGGRAPALDCRQGRRPSQPLGVIPELYHTRLVDRRGEICRRMRKSFDLLPVRHGCLRERFVGGIYRPRIFSHATYRHQACRRIAKLRRPRWEPRFFYRLAPSITWRRQCGGLKDNFLAWSSRLRLIRRCSIFQAATGRQRTRNILPATFMTSLSRYPVPGGPV